MSTPIKVAETSWPRTCQGRAQPAKTEKASLPEGLGRVVRGAEERMVEGLCQLFRHAWLRNGVHIRLAFQKQVLPLVGLHVARTEDVER
mmetsp:Transcript_93286/g.234418  ORF Transcript_93286/g.234418 Transcript_93286/m.234418 type:complete len:89 (-) Transcript_93286:802-1068(-)